MNTTPVTPKPTAVLALPGNLFTTVASRRA